MKLWAIADLHVGYQANRAALEALGTYPDDWLIVAGDAGDTPAQLDLVLRTLTPRFRQLVWVPGNHELWTPRGLTPGQRGTGHYDRLVALCRRHGVFTPEDPFPVWPGDGPLRVIAPLFLLYDYSFAPDAMAPGQAVAWAAERGLRSADEELLAPDPYPDRAAWCHARIADAEARLSALPTDVRLVLVNHFPFKRELAVLPRIPRFSIWCGTQRTEEWHRRFNVEAVVYGHLHLRASRAIDDVRFEEVSLGYPRQWDYRRGVDGYLRRIL
ncbi:MAG TPA: metallophosphoesterase [Vicinamibacterales bacterium]|nr:metallophosphoesterase [Vicinamibacterales bacterium]